MNNSFDLNSLASTQPKQSVSYQIAKLVVWVVGLSFVGWLGYLGVQKFAPQLLPSSNSSVKTMFERKVVAAEVPTVNVIAGEVKKAARTISDTDMAKYVYGGSSLVVQAGCKTELLTIPWNATMGLMLANGGQETTEGSLMAKHGVRLKLTRQNDYAEMQKEMIKFAEAVKRGETCPTEGAAYTIIMGDGYPAFAEGLREQMQKLGEGFEAVGLVGYSYGEDKCMMPYEVAKDPQKARGILIGAVPRDGDQNTCNVWAKTNDIPINADGKTYDPNAINYYEVGSFEDADKAYITGACEDRPVVSKGKRTGKTENVCVNGTATWTPGDVTVAKKKGGLAAIASTREYNYQMPAIVIGNRDFMKQNVKMVKGLLRAALEGGEIIQQGGDAALMRGAQVAAKVFGAETPEYWAKYYKGVVEKDAQGHAIYLGGSRVVGLSETSYLFGLNGMDNLYKRIYEQFGEDNAKYYPKETPTFPKYETVVNTSYLQALFEETPGAVQAAQASVPKFESGTQITSVVASRNWSIEFDSGKATIRPESRAALREMLNQIALSNLRVEIRGHTDDIGGDVLNIPLSKQRADTVKLYLMTNAPTSFPEGRVKVFGEGSSQPIAQGTSPQARQKNRRVEVILGKTD